MSANTIAFDRQNIIGGPAKLVCGSAAFWTEDNIKLRMDPDTRVLKPSLFGRTNEVHTDAVLKLSSFTPYGLLQNLSALYPGWATNPTIGQRLLGNADVAWQLWSNNGDLFTITNAAIIKPPSLKLSNGSPLFGPMDLVGVVGNLMNPAATNSYYKVLSGQADPGGVFADSAYKQQFYTAGWDSIVGYTAFQAQDEWDITFEPEWKPVKIQGWTRDYKLVSMTITAKCIPAGPTAAKTYAAVEEFAAGSRIGDKSIGDITITGDDGTTIFILKNMALKGRGYAFGADNLRHDALTWVNVVGLTAGVPGLLATLPSV